jgi:hypothetical protein
MTGGSAQVPKTRVTTGRHALSALSITRPDPHSPTLTSSIQADVSALEADADCRQIVLEKQLGETLVRDNTPPDWTWPSR